MNENKYVVDSIKKEMVKYIRKTRNGKNVKVGVFYAVESDCRGIVRIGWSKANEKAGDKFDKERGLIIAKHRSQANPANLPYMPSSIRNSYKYFRNNLIQHHFKGYTVDDNGGNFGKNPWVKSIPENPKETIEQNKETIERNWHKLGNLYK